MNAVTPIEADYSAFVRKGANGETEFEVLVTGARCAACMAKIERTVSAVAGVERARLNLTTGQLSVAFHRRSNPAGAVMLALDRLGYPAVPYAPAKAAAARDEQGRRLTLALGVAAFGAANAMMFSVPLWAGLFGQELGPGARTFMQICSGAVAFPCAIYAGLPFFESAFRSLKARHANMDVPISLGVLLTLGLSITETVLHGRDTYFDAAVSLLFLLLIGRWLDHRLRAKARGAAGDLLALQASVANVLGRDGIERATPIDAVMVGDLVRVRPGERLAVDAVVESGHSELDNALLTGEARPESVGPGDVCHAGAVNRSSLLTLRATARSQDSTLAAIARLIEAGAQSRSRYVRLADRAASIYVPVVHSAALATFLVCWAIVGVHEALIRAVAVLIITCPCALGLAVPAVQIAASARLFRAKVLLKSGAALERLAEVQHVVFDKTGVLTMGRPVLLDPVPALVAMAAPLARASSHPLSKALAAADPGKSLADAAVETPGQGVSGLIDGRSARLGRAAFVGVPDSDASEMELWFGFEGETKIRFRFEDEVRPDAARTIAALRERGLDVQILSGDRRGAVGALATALGVTDWRGQCTPSEKVQAIEALAGRGEKVLMVGDGLNDAAALAKAHCAMAPGSALDASQNAADLIFLGEDLFSVVTAVDVARAARHRALENFGFSALYNLVAGPAAMFGLVNPFLAALAMSGSSIVVTLNALRMARAGRRG